MADPSALPFDAFSESAKALIEVVLGKDQTDSFDQKMKDYSTLVAENSQLKAEAASVTAQLQETLSFKDKYGNLSIEFRKVAAERDSLRAKDLDATRIKADYEKLKGAYQLKNDQLAALQTSLEDQKSSVDAFSSLESLYQVFKETCERNGRNIRRIPVKIGVQFTLQNENGGGSSWYFIRRSRTNWQRVPY